MLRNELSRQGVAYPVAGALLAAGAPLGLLFMRRFMLHRRASIRDEVRRDFSTYAYVAASTTLAFALFGRALGRSAERLAELSTTDSLTGLLNARAFYPRLQTEIDRSIRTRGSVSLLLIDLDRLKQVNDVYGHAIGDCALQKLAHAIRAEMRSIDVAARLGGDEFGFLAVATTAAAGRTVAQRLLAAVADERIQEIGLPITASIGLATFDASRESRLDARELMRRTDRALYDAKRAGRNCIVSA